MTHADKLLRSYQFWIVIHDIVSAWKKSTYQFN